MRLQYGTEQCGSGGDWRNQPSRFPRWKRREGEPEREVAVSLDGGYVRDRNRRPERNFEVVVGKVSSGDSAIRFAFVRKGTYSASQWVRKALDASGYTDGVKITMLSDGDAGLRAIQQGVAPQAEHILDWFHLAMRFQHVSQTASGLTDDQVQPFVKQWLRAKIDRAKWNCWNGKAVKDYGISKT
jgi:transposase-like protein